MTAAAGMIGRVEIPYVPLPVRVTDHAVQRYVDRCGGDLPERWLKGVIQEETQAGLRAGRTSPCAGSRRPRRYVWTEGDRGYVLSCNVDAYVVVTTVLRGVAP